jgi:hypothetical protein
MAGVKSPRTTKACDVCGGPLAMQSRRGVCKKTLECKKEWSRRRPSEDLYDTCECGKRKSKIAKQCWTCYHEDNVAHPYMKDGYRFVPAPNHPRRIPMHPSRTGYVREHILVMEDSLGRYLLPGETVHHVNGVRDDNRFDNLQLRQGNHGPGAAFECAECGSCNIIAVRLR